MQKIFGIDNITSNQYGFKVLPFSQENLKDGECELGVMVRIMSESFSEIQSDSSKVIADAYQSFYLGEVRVKKANFQNLDEKKIADLFFQIMKECGNGAKSIHISNVSKEQDVLLFIFHQKGQTSDLSKGIIHLSHRIAEIEKMGKMDNRELPVLAESCELFFLHASSSKEPYRIRSLKERIQKLMRKESAPLERQGSFTTDHSDPTEPKEPPSKMTKTDPEVKGDFGHELEKKLAYRNLRNNSLQALPSYQSQDSVVQEVTAVNPHPPEAGNLRSNMVRKDSAAKELAPKSGIQNPVPSEFQSTGDRLGDLEKQWNVFESQKEFDSERFNRFGTELQDIMGQKDLNKDIINRIQTLMDKMTRLVFGRRLNEVESDLKVLESKRSFKTEDIGKISLKLQEILSDKKFEKLIEEQCQKMQKFMVRTQELIKKVNPK